MDARMTVELIYRMKAARPTTPARPAPERAAALPAPAVGTGLPGLVGVTPPVGEATVELGKLTGVLTAAVLIKMLDFLCI